MVGPECVTCQGIRELAEVHTGGDRTTAPPRPGSRSTPIRPRSTPYTSDCHRILTVRNRTIPLCITTDTHSHHYPATFDARFTRTTHAVPVWFPMSTLRFGLENAPGSINVR